MKSKQKLYSFYRPIYEKDEYMDIYEHLEPQKDIKIWISEKDIEKFEKLDVEGLKFDYIGITKDKRPQKNDVINNLKVVYILNVDKWNYILLEKLEGRIDE